MQCPHPACTGVHDNNRYRELCPASLDRKRDKDDRYYRRTVKGFRARMAKKYGMPVADHQALLVRFKTDPDAVVAEILRARRPGWFAS